VTKRTRFWAEGAPGAAAGFFGLAAGGASMDFPALAADAEARAMRTRDLGETVRESWWASGGKGACLAWAGFFRAAASGAGGAGARGAGSEGFAAADLRGALLSEGAGAGLASVLGAIGGDVF